MRRLVIRPGAIGDFIVSIPAIECLRADYLEVWVSPANVPLVRFAHRVRAIPSTGLDLLGITHTPESLVADLGTFDQIVSWYGANRTEFRELVQNLGLPFRFFTALPLEGAGLHATDFYLKQVSSITHCDSDGIPKVACDVRREEFAVIHPFSGSPKKNWPFEKFREVAASLQTTMPVYWCAGPEDPPLEGAVRIENLYELACWLARARLYFGNDSGITHLAAAVGTRVVAMFGPTDPAVWGPRGPNVEIRTYAWNS